MMVKVNFYHFFCPFLNFSIIINYIKIYKYIKNKIMKQKKNNNLIKLTLNGELVGYYSSTNRAAMKSGKAQASILWHLAHTGTWKDFDDEVWTVEVVDGSKITYDMINN